MNVNKYLIVSKAVLPDYFEKVIAARELIRSGTVKEVSEAVKQVGISRSTYYKYKDYVFAPSATDIARKAVVSLILDHEKGILARVLNALGERGANIITITQNPPISNKAAVVITMDVSAVEGDINDMIKSLSALKGVERLSLIDIA